MKKIGVFIFILTSIVLKAQEYSSINYFYNLGYHNPAYVEDKVAQFDFSSLSHFNNLPVGVYGVVLYGQLNTVSGIGGSLQVNSTSVGKESQLSKYQLNANYTIELNLKHKLTFGLGIKSFVNSYDESKLLTDIDLSTFEYSYGEGFNKDNSLQVPIGLGLHNDKIKAGAYFSKGLSTSDSYGLYGDLFVFQTKVNEYDLKDYVGLSFHREFLNSKMSFDNMVNIDNYKIDVFYAYTLSDGVRSYQTFGVGVFYNWRIFDINYQLAFNNNALGLSHQIGMQIFID